MAEANGLVTVRMSQEQAAGMSVMLMVARGAAKTDAQERALAELEALVDAAMEQTDGSVRVLEANEIAIGPIEMAAIETMFDEMRSDAEIPAARKWSATCILDDLLVSSMSRALTDDQTSFADVELPEYPAER